MKKTYTRICTTCKGEGYIKLADGTSDIGFIESYDPIMCTDCNGNGTITKPMPDIVYGQMIYNDKCKIGSFRLEYDKWSDRLAYRYYTEKGHKGAGVLSVIWVRQCLEENRLLYTDPKMGKADSYVFASKRKIIAETVA